MSENVTQESCKYFVQRKKRYCKMLVKLGHEFCGEHQKPTALCDDMDPNDKKLRILCPLDRKHTVYAHNLTKHLKICNARETTAEDYIQKNINSGKTAETGSDINDSYQLLSTFSKDRILEVITKVNRLFEKFVRLSDNKLSHKIVENEIEKPEYGDKTRKHLKQVSAILGLLDYYNFVQENTCFIEFGAGRGQLSCWIAQATASLSNSHIVLVERASPKHKKDNKLAKTTDRIHRIRADIKDIVLEKLDVVKSVENVIGVTKHLCGEATDLAIRCLTNATSQKDKIKGSVFTFCCHHRCRWTPYTGKFFFQENELSMEDFNIMCGLSSWATCGSGLSREYRNKSGDNQDNEKTQYGLDKAEREATGRRCKNVLNWGRLEFLKRHGFACTLHNYVDDAITLENVCIVARKQ